MMPFSQRHSDQKGQVLVCEVTGSELAKVYAHLHQERRAEPRYPCSLTVGCEPVAGKGQEPWGAEVRDISASGIALIVERRFEPGTILVVMPPEQFETPASLLARVVRAQAYGSGRWIIGCKLVNRLGEDDLRGLLDA
jgi:hypothetical protein